MRCIGYYIVESVPKPEFVSVPSEILLTVSRCICNTHPNLTGCFWMGHKQEKKEYKKYLNLSGEKFENLYEITAKLFEEKIIDVDGRFVKMDAARNFYNRYLKWNGDIKIVGVFANEVLLVILMFGIILMG